jgi:hypothetical protein
MAKEDPDRGTTNLKDHRIDGDRQRLLDDSDPKSARLIPSDSGIISQFAQSAPAEEAPSPSTLVPRVECQ